MTDRGTQDTRIANAEALLEETKRRAEQFRGLRDTRKRKRCVGGRFLPSNDAARRSGRSHGARGNASALDAATSTNASLGYHRFGSAFGGGRRTENG